MSQESLEPPNIGGNSDQDILFLFIFQVDTESIFKFIK